MLWTVLIGNLGKVAITYSTSSVKNFYNRRHLHPSPASFLSTQPYTCIKFKKLRQFKSWFASWNWNALENTPFAAWTHVGTVWSRPLIAPYQSCAQWPENHPVVPGLHFLAMPCGSKCFNRQAEFVSFSLQVLKFNKHQPPKSFASPLLDRCEEGRTHALIALGDV